MIILTAEKIKNGLWIVMLKEISFCAGYCVVWIVCNKLHGLLFEYIIGNAMLQKLGEVTCIML